MVLRCFLSESRLPGGYAFLPKAHFGVKHLSPFKKSFSPARLQILHFLSIWFIACAARWGVGGVGSPPMVKTYGFHTFPSSLILAYAKAFFDF